jgi:hypothetical protein
VKRRPRRGALQLTLRGVSLTLSEWAERLQLPRHGHATLRKRLRLGWSVEATLKTPVRAYVRCP